MLVRQDGFCTVLEDDFNGVSLQRQDSNLQSLGYEPSELPLLHSAMGAGCWQDIRPKKGKNMNMHRQQRRSETLPPLLYSISQYHFTIINHAIP